MSSSLEGVYEAGIVDPGVPNPKPTKSFWQSEPHPLANHQSPWPTAPVDVIIIGSGVTGTNLARNLLAKRPNLKVVVVEARSLCSGATGRNGGHIKTMAFAVWEDRKRAYGIQEAIRLSAFERSHLDAMTVAARDNGIECDAVFTEGIDAYYDKKTFDKALAALEDMRVHAPHLAAQYTVYTERNHLRQIMKLSDRCIGAIGVPSASIWPYKLITGLMGRLIQEGKVNVQTNTVVRSVDDVTGDEFATVHTDRGTIKARHIVHATNAWIGHLLPELRPFVSPVRGNVVQYAPAITHGSKSGTSSALGLDSQYSFWLRYAEKDYDYLIQREQGDVVVGRANTGRRTTGDDSETDLSPMAHLRGFAHEVAALPSPTASANIQHAWSGILGFTEDGAPFVGKLPFPGRSHQWVSGAYHGIGMTKAFRTAEMMSYLMLGIEVPEEYPRSMLVTQERIRLLKRSVDIHQTSQKAKL
ncbi:FAD dependent oxidoreductase [Mariannaea sp. PMI_226]|nr:FAD dependent oxidoreductase [Mariannaea sp. PMI_226]